MTRDFHGFYQWRESAGERWRFYITGFHAYGDPDRCNVLRTDKTTATVPIDKRDRILIDGRWYGRAHWRH